LIIPKHDGSCIQTIATLKKIPAGIRTFRSRNTQTTSIQRSVPAGMLSEENEIIDDKVIFL